jgi:DNA-binding GntR family transcriptional regulator
MMVSFDATTSPDLLHYAENHWMLLDALRGGEAGGVEHVFREHIESVGDALIQRMNGAEPASGAGVGPGGKGRTSGRPPRGLVLT